MKGKCLLIPLDLSAAFDTVYHKILLERLSSNYGIEGTALKWYKSYLTDRDQSVIINGKKSLPQPLNFCVPQGSILGPELFTKYAAPVAAIIRKYKLKYHVYADDTQLYILFDTDDLESSIKCIELCIAEIRKWMAKNYLKFNDGKTELILLGSKHQLKQIPHPVIRIGNSAITCVDSVRNIGVQFDQKITMAEHVIKTCKSANFHLRNIGRVRKFLTQDATIKLVHAFISSKLDYGNALLSGIQDQLLQKLQRVQNSAARIVTKTSRYSHIKPILKMLHWLPIKQRIDFKVLLLAFKAQIGQAPNYISEMLKPYKPSKSLRSADKLLLCEPKINLQSYGNRSFSSVAPRLWNDLPMDIKQCKTVDSFKQKLKCHLFKIAYD
jgi:hypothetical protein